MKEKVWAESARRVPLPLFGRPVKPTLSIFRILEDFLEISTGIRENLW
jgi:hypothetical protein